jgi:hypothetical protein
MQRRAAGPVASVRRGSLSSPEDVRACAFRAAPVRTSGRPCPKILGDLRDARNVTCSVTVECPRTVPTCHLEERAPECYGVWWRSSTPGCLHVLRSVRWISVPLHVTPRVDARPMLNNTNLRTCSFGGCGTTRRSGRLVLTAKEEWRMSEQMRTAGSGMYRHPRSGRLPQESEEVREKHVPLLRWHDPLRSPLRSGTQVLGLQRLVGNRAVMSILGGLGKTTVQRHGPGFQNAKYVEG